MGPFLQFRLWLRRAPSLERATAALSGLVVVALLAWALVPGSGPGSSVSTTAAPSSASGAGTGGQAGAPTSGAPTTPAGSGTVGQQTPLGTGGVAPTSGGPGPAGSAATAGGATTGAVPGTAQHATCGSSGTTDHGVTAGQVRIGVAVPALAGQAGNGLFGLPSPQTEEQYFQAVVDWTNAHGGLQCRKLVATYYEGDPLDQNEEHSLCLQIEQDDPFAVLDSNFSYTPADKDCLEQAKIPDVNSAPVLVSERKQYYPYIFSYFGMWDRIILDFALGAKQLGWFNGAKKVGVLEEDCFPEVNSQMAAALAQAGVPPGEITTFDYGCPSGLIPPNEHEQAVLQFKAAGVTHVIDNVSSGSANDFSKDAQQQDYHPRYGFPDMGAVATFQTAEFAPDPTNFNGALAVTTTQYGADKSHLPETGGTRTCDQIMATIGAPPAELTADAYGGVACDLVSMFLAAATKAVPLTRSGLVSGLAQAGHLDFSFPAGPANFTTSGVVTGGQYWRHVVFDGSCSCFKVPDPTFQPNY